MKQTGTTELHSTSIYMWIFQMHYHFGKVGHKATKFGVIIIIPRIHYKGNSIESAKMAKYGNN